MRILNILKLELIVLFVVLGVGALILIAMKSSKGDGMTASHELIGEDLEPFRSAFNAASDRVRAVLLVGPT